MAIFERRQGAEEEELNFLDEVAAGDDLSELLLNLPAVFLRWHLGIIVISGFLRLGMPCLVGIEAPLDLEHPVGDVIKVLHFLECPVRLEGDLQLDSGKDERHLTLHVHWDQLEHLVRLRFVFLFQALPLRLAEGLEIELFLHRRDLLDPHQIDQAGELHDEH